MAKITVEKGVDLHNRLYFRLSKKRGTISQREAYEAMEKEGEFGRFLMDFPVTEDVPEEYYEEGDAWYLYPVDEMLDMAAEDKFGEGYEACMRDYKLDKES